MQKGGPGECGDVETWPACEAGPAGLPPAPHTPFHPTPPPASHAQILKTIRAACAPDARLLLCEIALPDGRPADFRWSCMDLQVCSAVRTAAAPDCGSPVTLGDATASTVWCSGQLACRPSAPALPWPLLFSDDMCGSKERTESEWRQVMAGGGFELEQALPLSCGQSMIVGRPV